MTGNGQLRDDLASVKDELATLTKKVNGLNVADKLAALTQKIDGIEERRGGMLSSSDFLECVILTDLDDAKRKFWDREWDDSKFIIDPFDPARLTPFSYDLSVGNEIYSCSRDRQEVTYLGEGTDATNTYELAPRETVIIKTKEYIALPPCYSATVWPRFAMPAEAIFQSMVKIDPTWYGELGVAVTNLAPGGYPITDACT